MTSFAPDYLRRLPRELWVRHILPEAAGPGFLPGMLGVSRYARELALDVCERVLQADDNMPRPLRVTQRPQPPPHLPAPIDGCLVARARHYEQRVRSRGGLTEDEMTEQALEVMGHYEVYAEDRVSALRGIRELFGGYPYVLDLSKLELPAFPYNVFDHQQLRCLKFDNNQVARLAFQGSLPNLEILTTHDTQNSSRLDCAPDAKIAERLPRLRMVSLCLTLREMRGDWVDECLPLACPRLEFIHLLVWNQGEDEDMKATTLPAVLYSSIGINLVLIRFDQGRNCDGAYTFSVERTRFLLSNAWLEQRRADFLSLLNRNGAEDWLFDTEVTGL